MLMQLLSYINNILTRLHLSYNEKIYDMASQNLLRFIKVSAIFISKMFLHD